ncbi:CatB-related O-acetyltransferase [Paenirhodobacter sp.]|uniref:CatB-related O-acetyltransferase n=1 Tax=Paenirhodobacter sp. TaxID=1965326 RepID=UPI003B408C77
MTEQTYTLSHADIQALDKLGLRIPGLRDTRRLARGSQLEGPVSVISSVPQGAFVDIGAFCNLSGGTINNARFGRYCSVASGVVIGPHEHPTDWLTTSRTAYFPQVNGWDDLVARDRKDEIRQGRRPFAGSCPITEIGHDVWIGQGAFVKSGVSIGTGSIIGARATVLRDVPPYSIVVGTPGKVLRLRFPEKIVERLLAAAWWRYSIYDLFSAPFDDIEKALDVIEEAIGSGRLSAYEGPIVTAEDLADPKGLASRLADRFLPPLAQAS